MHNTFRFNNANTIFVFLDIYMQIKQQKKTTWNGTLRSCNTIATNFLIWPIIGIARIFLIVHDPRNGCAALQGGARLQWLQKPTRVLEGGTCVLYILRTCTRGRVTPWLWHTTRLWEVCGMHVSFFIIFMTVNGLQRDLKVCMFVWVFSEHNARAY